jgi:hypothetical protein
LEAGNSELPENDLIVLVFRESYIGFLRCVMKNPFLILRFWKIRHTTQHAERFPSSNNRKRLALKPNIKPEIIFLPSFSKE